MGEFSRAVGLTPATLRYYERIGLLARPARRGGKRWYDAGALGRARILKAARQAGLRISDLKVLTQSANDPMRRAKVLEARLDATDREIRRLGVARANLARAVACSCSDASQCEIAKDAERTRH